MNSTSESDACSAKTTPIEAVAQRVSDLQFAVDELNAVRIGLVGLPPETRDAADTAPRGAALKAEKSDSMVMQLSRVEAILASVTRDVLDATTAIRSGLL